MHVLLLSLLRFSMEMHMVHRNSKYPDLESAFGQIDGIAVFAALFEINPYGGYGSNWIRGFRPHPHIPAVLLVFMVIL